MKTFVESARKIVVVILLLGIVLYSMLLLVYVANVSTDCCKWVMGIVMPDAGVRVYTFGLPFCAVAAFGIVGLFEWHSPAEVEGTRGSEGEAAKATEDAAKEKAPRGKPSKGKDVASKVSFKAFGLEFSGPAGPVTLWVLCYLALVGSVRLIG
jgi:hypothetical protein